IPSQDAQKMQKYKPYADAIPLRKWFGGATGNQLLLMQLGALLLLILAAANLGNLALVRMLRRRHELGLRLALGANRLTLLRLAFSETLPLGIAAAILGWILSRIGASALTHFGIASGGTAFAIDGGGSVAWLGVVLSLIVAFIALSAPMFLVRSRHLMGLLQSGGGKGAAGGRGSKRTRKGLSVVQIALAVMLLSASALVGLSLQRTLNQNTGFKPDNLTVASVNLTGSAYDSYGKIVGAWRATQSAVAALPGVRAVGVGTGVPFTSGGSQNPFRVASQGAAAHGRSIFTNVTVAGVTLLKTLDLRLLHGRLLDAADAQGDAYNIVADASFAKALFGTTNVVGRSVETSGYTFRIVGVVAPIRTHSGHGGFNTSRGTVFVPPTKTANLFSIRPIVIVIRSPLPAPAVVRELKSALAQALPGQAITQVSSMRGLIADSTQGTSALATLLIAFGILAFVLASIGTYGVVAYLTRLRRREFAIRLVLGARPWQIEWLVLGQGVALWAFGAVIGIGLAFLFGRFLHGQLYGVSLLSPAAYIVPALVLGFVVALASWLPARRVRRTALAETLNPQ
ncbi:MAG: FtsX-like permease family protein, partial [Gammaproteobacteria bacterium]